MVGNRDTFREFTDDFANKYENKNKIDVSKVVNSLLETGYSYEKIKLLYEEYIAESEFEIVDLESEKILLNSNSNLGELEVKLTDAKIKLAQFKDVLEYVNQKIDEQKRNNRTSSSNQENTYTNDETRQYELNVEIRSLLARKMESVKYRNSLIENIKDIFDNILANINNTDLNNYNEKIKDSIEKFSAVKYNEQQYIDTELSSLFSELETLNPSLDANSLYSNELNAIAALSFDETKVRDYCYNAIYLENILEQKVSSLTGLFEKKPYNELINLVEKFLDDALKSSVSDQNNYLEILMDIRKQVNDVTKKEQSQKNNSEMEKYKLNAIMKKSLGDLYLSTNQRNIIFSEIAIFLKNVDYKNINCQEISAFLSSKSYVYDKILDDEFIRIQQEIKDTFVQLLNIDPNFDFQEMYSEDYQKISNVTLDDEIAKEYLYNIIYFTKQLEQKRTEIIDQEELENINKLINQIETLLEDSLCFSLSIPNEFHRMKAEIEKIIAEGENKKEDKPEDVIAKEYNELIKELNKKNSSISQTFELISNVYSVEPFNYKEIDYDTVNNYLAGINTYNNEIKNIKEQMNSLSDEYLKIATSDIDTNPYVDTKVIDINVRIDYSEYVRKHIDSEIQICQEMLDIVHDTSKTEEDFNLLNNLMYIENDLLNVFIQSLGLANDEDFMNEYNNAMEKLMAKLDEINEKMSMIDNLDKIDKTLEPDSSLEMPTMQSEKIEEEIIEEPLEPAFDEASILAELEVIKSKDPKTQILELSERLNSSIAKFEEVSVDIPLTNTVDVNGKLYIPDNIESIGNKLFILDNIIVSYQSAFNACILNLNDTDFKELSIKCAKISENLKSYSFASQEVLEKVVNLVVEKLENIINKSEKLDLEQIKRNVHAIKLTPVEEAINFANDHLKMVRNIKTRFTSYYKKLSSTAIFKERNDLLKQDFENAKETINIYEQEIVNHINKLIIKKKMATPEGRKELAEPYKEEGVSIVEGIESKSAEIDAYLLRQKLFYENRTIDPKKVISFIGNSEKQIDNDIQELKALQNQLRDLSLKYKDTFDEEFSELLKDAGKDNVKIDENAEIKMDDYLSIDVADFFRLHGVFVHRLSNEIMDILNREDLSNDEKSVNIKPLQEGIKQEVDIVNKYFAIEKFKTNVAFESLYDEFMAKVDTTEEKQNEFFAKQNQNITDEPVSQEQLEQEETEYRTNLTDALDRKKEITFSKYAIASSLIPDNEVKAGIDKIKESLVLVDKEISDLIVDEKNYPHINRKAIYEELKSLKEEEYNSLYNRYKQVYDEKFFFRKMYFNILDITKKIPTVTPGSEDYQNLKNEMFNALVELTNKIKICQFSYEFVEDTEEMILSLNEPPGILIYKSIDLSGKQETKEEPLENQEKVGEVTILENKLNFASEIQEIKYKIALLPVLTDGVTIEILKGRIKIEYSKALNEKLQSLKARINVSVNRVDTASNIINVITQENENGVTQYINNPDNLDKAEMSITDENGELIASYNVLEDYKQGRRM